MIITSCVKYKLLLIINHFATSIIQTERDLKRIEYWYLLKYTKGAVHSGLIMDKNVINMAESLWRERERERERERGGRSMDRALNCRYGDICAEFVQIDGYDHTPYQSLWR